MKLRKQFIVILLFIILCFCCNYTNNNFVFADNGEINYYIDEQIDSLELDEVQDILSEYNNLDIAILKKDIKETINELINGEFLFTYQSLTSFFIALFTSQLKKALPMCAVIVVVGILLSMLSEFSLTERDDVKNITNIAFIGIVIVITTVQFVAFLQSARATLSGISLQMQAFFPVLLTIMGAIGSFKSASLFQPLMLLLINIISNIIINFMLPLINVSLVFNIMTNLTDNFKFDKLCQFFSNIIKWGLGFIFTIFTAFTAIQGISVGTFDSISIRTAKYTIRSYIPIIGGYLSDSFNIIMASSVLIKNAIGFTGIICLFSSVLLPVVSMVIFKFCIEFCGAVLEPVCDKKICDYLSGLSKLATILISVVIVCSFMYMIMLTMIMSTANLI